MWDESNTGLSILVVILTAILVLAVGTAIVQPSHSTPARTAAAASAPTNAETTPEQAALIAKHELVPGFSRDNAIDAIGTALVFYHKDGRRTVLLPNLGMGRNMSDSSAGGVAGFGSNNVTRGLVLASWGSPDSYLADPLGKIDAEFLIYHEPQGEVQVCCVPKNDCSKIITKLAPAYFKERFPAWTDTECAAVAAGRVWLGMTTEMARIVLGDPSDINRSVGAWGVREQWVYSTPDSYFYFGNGILTSWTE
jgi:hypothetical protein